MNVTRLRELLQEARGQVAAIPTLVDANALLSEERDALAARVRELEAQAAARVSAPPPPCADTNPIRADGEERKSVASDDSNPLVALSNSSDYGPHATPDDKRRALYGLAPAPSPLPRTPAPSPGGFWRPASTAGSVSSRSPGRALTPGRASFSGGTPTAAAPFVTVAETDRCIYTAPAGHDSLRWVTPTKGRRLSHRR